MKEFVALREAASAVLLGFSMLTSAHAGAPGLTVDYPPSRHAWRHHDVQNARDDGRRHDARPDVTVASRRVG